MTAKKKPRTGGDGASSNSLHGDDGSWGELSITAILRPGREHRKTTGAGGTGLSPTRFADCGAGTYSRLSSRLVTEPTRWAVPACRGPEIRAGLRCDHVWIGFMVPAAGCRPHAQ